MVTGLALVTISPDPGILFETQNLTLTCSIDGGVGDANFTWLRNGVELPGSEVNVTIVESQLTILHLTVAQWNAVCITCQAVAMTTTGSDLVNLTVVSKSHNLEASGSTL